MASEIQMIPIEQLHAHPKNPRMELGDLAELAASIRQQGVLQNLTVVEDPDGGFRVIIGHRRREAAGIAGLKAVPCAVVQMSEDDQIATMLSENMQRNDLSITEQVKGVRDLLDLCLGEKEIEKKTGLGKSVVKSRIEIAKKMEMRSVRQAEKAGATLIDILNLSRLPQECQDRAIEAAEAGEKHLGEAIADEARRMTNEAELKKLEAAMEAAGIECDFKGSVMPQAPKGYRWFYDEYLMSAKAAIEKAPEERAKFDEVRLVWNRANMTGSFWHLGPEPDEDAARHERKEKAAERRMLVDKMKAEIVKSMSRCVAASDWMDAEARKFANTVLSCRTLYAPQEAPGMDAQAVNLMAADMQGEDLAGALGELGKKKPMLGIVVNLFLRLLCTETMAFLSWDGRYVQDNGAKKVFGTMKILGWQPEEWMEKLADGTHEVYEE